ncbi:PEP-CTERM sorting domain-containing protein [Allorhodopirellula solitaria]|uniref:Ice-binding protein C-terminal domain-containing protein n=1 Tax=Allorhodopirellula solitaria TaxID=2527987 RepID=A0A5C5XSZ2_9BACT|nr:PEP-CTERM sorting domain-containing protein [Allorhodopirellula solitaria]TWT66020.1 hypothetical protein CA85_28790 [Allorhodopirellula solitaria]
MNLRIVAAVVIASLTCGLSPASAALVTYIFTGNTSVTIGASYFDNVDYQVEFSIDSSAPDLLPATNVGGFSGGQTRLTLTDVSASPVSTNVTNALSTNVTGIRLERYNPSDPQQQFISLADPLDFTIGANTGQWSSNGPLVTVNSISPFDPSLLPSQASNRYSGPNGPLLWDFVGGAPNVAFNDVRTFFASNGVAAVPEPSALVACGLGVAGAYVYGRRKRRVIS